MTTVRRSAASEEQPQDLKYLPIGMQTFGDLVEGNFVYVDKTEQIHRLLRKSKGRYFLSRPRRFGKSLLISTLEALFQGKQKLFKNLWIGKEGRWDWSKQYPVIRLDLSRVANENAKHLQQGLCRAVRKMAALHKVELGPSSVPSDLLEDLIERLAQDEQVVVLIDEYDKPLVDNLGEGSLETAKANRAVLKKFYGALKDDKNLRFLFITGVSKFAQTSVFSELNNLDDLTLSERAAELVGYTDSELRENFAGHIDRLAQKLGQDRQEVLGWVQKWYNGYRFSEKDARVYNPFTTLLLFENRNFSSYWYKTGTPTFLLHLIDRQPQQERNFVGYEVPDRRFQEAWDVERLELLPLLVQTGYLTIEDCRRVETNELLYRVHYPNLEVEQAFVEQLAEYRCAPKRTALVHALREEDLKAYFEQMEAIIEGIPYQMRQRDRGKGLWEGFYHTLFHLINDRAGLFPHSEVSSHHGRIDAVIHTKTRIYLFELKADATTPQEAVRQIKDTKTYKPYLDEEKYNGKPITLVGVSFKRFRSHGKIDWAAEELIPR
ncbi:MAG: AAA family ATPase [Myxococcota bacterium]